MIEFHKRYSTLKNLLSAHHVTSTSVIIQSFKTREFLYFSSVQNFLEFNEKLNIDEKCYSEVILSEDTQKFRLDFDADKSIVFEKSYLDELHAALCEIVNSTIVYNVFTSHTVTKTSVHVVYDLYTINSLHNKQIYLLLKDKLKSCKYFSHFDSSVYKSTQMFRLPGHHKHKSRVIKFNSHINNGNIIKGMLKPYSNDTRIDYFRDRIYIFIPPPPSQYNYENINIGCLNQKTINDILETSSEYLKDMKLREVIQNKIVFNRIRSGYCKICSRTHDSENNIYIIVYNKYHRIYCRRNDTKFVQIDKPSYYDLDFSPFSLVTSYNSGSEISPDPLIEISNNSNIDKDYYCNSTMKCYDFKGISKDNKILLVKGNMKLGKTKELFKHINSSNYSTVLFISFRILFSLDIQTNSSLGGKVFSNYLDIKDKSISLKKYPFLIIQVDSLSRLNLNDGFPELLVLDESESIFQQFSSPYLRNKLRVVWSIFDCLCRYSTRIITIDGNLSMRSFNIMKIYSDNIKMHINTFSALKSDFYYFFNNFYSFMNVLCEKCSNNNKIIIPTNSLKKGKIIYSHLVNRYPLQRIILYSSESDDFTKRKDFLNVNKEWLKYDIVIYTPCITAGVSFEKIHFDFLFGYFTNHSCDVFTILQMLYRVRQLKENKMYLMIENKPISDPLVCSTREELLEYSKIQFNKILDNCLSFQIDYDKDLKIVTANIEKDSYYYLWLENKQIELISSSYLLKEFLSILKMNDCLFDCYNFSTKSCNYNEMQLLKQIGKEENEKILLVRDVIDIEDINNKILLTEEEKIIKKRYFLRNIYNYHDKPITLQFLSRFNNPKLIRIAINLSKIKNFTSSIETIYPYLFPLRSTPEQTLDCIFFISVFDIYHFRKIIDYMNSLTINLYDLDTKILKEKFLLYIKKSSKKYNQVIESSKDDHILSIKKLLYDNFGIKLVEKPINAGGNCYITVSYCDYFDKKRFPLKINCEVN